MQGQKGWGMTWRLAFRAAVCALLIGLPAQSVSPAVPMSTALGTADICQERDGKFRELVSEQDGQIADLKAQVEQLRLALASRSAEAEARRLEAEARETQAALYRQMWLDEAEKGAADRRRAFWGEKFNVLKYGLLGFSAGVVAERLAE